MCAGGCVCVCGGVVDVCARAHTGAMCRCFAGSSNKAAV